MIYRGVVLLHVVAVIVFFGNIVVGLIWKARADRDGDPRLIAHAFATLQFVDAVVTPAAVVAILVTGVAAAWIVKLPIFGTGWVLWSLLAFALSGLVFVARVLPLQRDLAEWTQQTSTFDRVLYRARSRAWVMWANLSLAAATAALVIMVLRLPLPAWAFS